MINSVSLKNFGHLIDLKWNNLSSINLIIGENASGKTFLLKTIYSAIKTIEDYKKGDDIKSASEILADKLHWIFQDDAIGYLVNKANSLCK